MIDIFGDKNNGEIVTYISHEDGSTTRISIIYKSGRLEKIVRQVMNSEFEIIEEKIEDKHAANASWRGVLNYTQKSNPVNEADLVKTIEFSRIVVQERMYCSDWIFNAYINLSKILETQSGIPHYIWLDFIDVLNRLNRSNDEIIKIMRAAGLKIEE